MLWLLASCRPCPIKLGSVPSEKITLTPWETSEVMQVSIFVGSPSASHGIVLIPSSRRAYISWPSARCADGTELMISSRPTVVPFGIVPVPTSPTILFAAAIASCCGAPVCALMPSGVVASLLCEPALPVSGSPPLPVGIVNVLAPLLDAEPLLVLAAALELELELELLLLPHAATVTAATARTTDTPSLARTFTIVSPPQPDQQNADKPTVCLITLTDSMPSPRFPVLGLR